MGINNFQDLLHRLAQTLRADGAILLAGGDFHFYGEDLKPLPVVREGEPGWSASQALLSAIHTVGKYVFPLLFTLAFISEKLRSALIELTFYLPAFRNRGGDLDAAQAWVKYLTANPMYTNVGMQDIFIPLGPWMPREYFYSLASQYKMIFVFLTE